MRKALTLILALSLVVIFSGAALAGGFGECSYGSRAKLTVADKADASKIVASKDETKAEGDKFALVQKTDTVSKPSTTKK